MPDWKTIPLAPMVGMFDALSSNDQIQYGNYRVVKNAVTRSQRNRQRGGGWLRFFGEAEVFNNQDLHDQLLDRLVWRDSYTQEFIGGGGIAGYGYPYSIPSYIIPGYAINPPATGFYCGAYIGNYPDHQFNGCDIFYPFVGYPYVFIPTAEDCATAPNFFAPAYQKSYFWTSCPLIYDAVTVPGFVYGEPFPFYESQLGYESVYCGNYLHYREGCNEAITMLNEIVVDTGRKLIASTMSRVYELNQSAGNWRLLADGLGNAGYTVDQCGCNSTRGTSATMGGYFLYTNNFDPPLIYFSGDEQTGCDMRALQVITDLQALGISRAGGVVTWKGFAIFFDLTENSARLGGDVIWSDLEAPFSLIPSDVSLAGRATVAVGETILAAAPLGNWLMLYTDKSIIRVTLVGGLEIFNFERIYRGGNSLRFKHSLIDTGDMHIYLGESDIYVMTQFDTHPLAVAWVSKAAGMIFNGIHETDANYEPINNAMCDLVTGGWSEEKHEAWLSWCSGSNTCPDVTLRLNLRFNTADFVDHGFTAFLTFRPDTRPTIGQWIEDLGICPRGTHVAVGIKDGPVCEGAVAAVENPPLYIRNPEESPDFPVHPDSLCARLAGKTIDDFCKDCSAPTKFVMASAQDFCLKQYQDDIYFRERLGFGSNPCRDYLFQTEAGASAGITGPPIVLDTWLSLSDVNCTVSDVKMLIKFSPCAAAGGLGYSEFFETGQTLSYQSAWPGIAFCDSLDMVISDSDDGTGIALLDFNASPPAVDHILPLNTPFEVRGLHAHPKADVIIAWVRYGTFPSYSYRLAFLDPLNGLSSEVDLGVPGGTNQYEAYFCNIGFSTMGILIRSLTNGNPHMIAVVDVDTRAVIVSQTYENTGGTVPTRDFYGICYSCELGELVSIANRFDGVEFFKNYLVRLNVDTLAITNEFLLPPTPVDIRFPQYLTSTGHVFGWDVLGYWDIDPADGTATQVDSLLVGNVVPLYQWKLDRMIALDGGNSQVILYNPHDWTKTVVPIATGIGDSWYFCCSRTTGKFFVRDSLLAPFLIHELNVS